MDDHSYTIDEFCRRERICRATFYNLLRAGKGPRVMLIGAHKRISSEARADWRREREAEAAESARA